MSASGSWWRGHGGVINAYLAHLFECGARHRVPDPPHSITTVRGNGRTTSDGQVNDHEHVRSFQTEINPINAHDQFDSTAVSSMAFSSKTSRPLVAGGLWWEPSRTSNRAPCNGHEMNPPRSRPVSSGVRACEHRLAIARSTPSILQMMTPSSPASGKQRMSPSPRSERSPRFTGPCYGPAAPVLLS